MTDKKTPAQEEDDLFDQESSSELFKFDKIGQKVTGLVTNRKEGKTKLGDAIFYTVLQKQGEVTFVPTKSLGEDLDKFVRQYGIGKTLVDIEYTEDKKGNYPDPFKVFKVRAGAATESRLASMGIATFDTESTTGE